MSKSSRELNPLLKLSRNGRSKLNSRTSASGMSAENSVQTVSTCKDTTSDVAVAKVILKSFGLDGIAIMRDVIQWIQEIDFTRKKLASTKQKQTLSEFMRQSLAPRDETTTNRLQSSEHPQEWYLIITKKTILYS